MNSRKLFFEVNMENILNVTYKNNGNYNVVICDDYDGLAGYIKELFPNY